MLATQSTTPRQAVVPDADTHAQAEATCTQNKLYPSSCSQRFAAVIMRIREPKTTALIFASGKMVSLRRRQSRHGSPGLYGRMLCFGR
jgi:TATA-box binding protein (TBP) (component of TFIID and TFIIIB)